MRQVLSGLVMIVGAVALGLAVLGFNILTIPWMVIGAAFVVVGLERRARSVRSSTWEQSTTPRLALEQMPVRHPGPTQARAATVEYPPSPADAIPTSVLVAARLVYAQAVLQLAAALATFTSDPTLRAQLRDHSPHDTAAQLAAALHDTHVMAVLGLIIFGPLYLVLGRSIRRGSRWAQWLVWALALYTVVYWMLLGPSVPVGGPALVTIAMAHGLLLAATVILLSLTTSRAYLNSTRRPSAWRRRTA